MDIMQIVAMGLVATVLAVTVKQDKPELGIFITIAAGIIIFTIILSKLVSIIDILYDLSIKSNLDNMYISIVLKVVAVSYIAEFGAQICKDAGEGTIAKKIELGGKIVILTMAIPILTALMEVIVKILP
ncbi:MAG: stage III sporulation protein AD [Xylanivirga thermophila]|jgi:stage III sporulation protein AD|uniref:stage III sporulation protein AD n=1 Tax=Xylanivirga thermophila TaxID=2496273 RepID=UPI00101C9231|nr:stage III sporulation protein AD [Xylanivirga thermophila]